MIRIVGVVAARTTLADQADPGKHLFMVVAENSDFMNADLTAGTTWPAPPLTPRGGA